MKAVMVVINYGMFVVLSVLFTMFICTFLVKAYNGVLIDQEFQSWMYAWLVGSIYTGCNTFVLTRK